MAQENFYTEVYPDIIEQWKFYLELLELKKGDKVLDIGCNRGDTEIFMINSNSQIEKVIGIDIDENKLKDARKKLETKFHKEKIEFQKMDACNLEFEDGTFDKIICAETIEWVDNPKKVIEEIKRVLKPNGIGIVQHTDFDSQIFTTNQLNLTRKIINKFTDSGPNGTIGRKLLGLCKKANFKEITPLVYTVINENFEKNYYSYQIAHMMKDWLVNGDEIEEEKLNNWLNDLKEIDEKNDFFYSINRNLVICKK
ncbi:hypothetical protein JCM16358_23720 [Halanaerocella petrolearia]